MKTLKKVLISIKILKLGEPIPENMEFGILYYSSEYKSSNHLCLCGCGHECYLPIKENEWNLIIENNKPTITPSILQRFECKSHYIINNRIANFV